MCYPQQSGNSCGAYSIYYYLLETNSPLLSAPKSDPNSIYDGIQFIDGELAADMKDPIVRKAYIDRKYSSPARMVSYMRDNLNVSTKAYITNASPLRGGFANYIVGNNVTSVDLLSTLEVGKYAITIWSAGGGALHYMLTKKVGPNTFDIFDSNGINSKGNASYKGQKLTAAVGAYTYLNAGLIIG